MRKAKVISLSLTPEMAKALQQHAKENHCSVSEFLLKALRQYMTNRDLASVRAEGRKIAKRKKLKPDEVDQIVRRGRHLKSVQRGLRQAASRKFAKDPRSAKDAKLVNDVED